MDPLLERASEAIFGQPEDKIPAAAAFLLHRIQERLNLPAVNISAGIIRGLLDQYEVALPEIGEPEQLPGEPSDVSKLLFDKTLEIFRSCDSFLNSADLQALEQKTALMPLAKYLAHRQIVENSLFFQQMEIKSPPLATRTRRVSSNIRNEDQYPIGGYSSISNKGTFESLLHSQLAYMSPDRSEKPDTFDLKFLREELFYYSRDENIFLRQRRKFIFVFAEDLKNARLKDDGAPVQRLILALALVDAILQKLTERLAQDALHFHLLFLRSEEPLELQPERELLQILQRDGIQRGAVQLEEVAPNLLNEKILNLRKEINCDILLLSYRVELANNELIDENLTLGTPRPILSHSELEPVEDYLENWSNTYQFLMSKWLAQ
ncbi:hypothetical protein KIH39_05370 [Telmatocola sphagniphila]|uniref:FtsH ternary systems vWA domain-containing protein n=2 Tax=Telmatocola sphagniphila TaxID=1123043 RepID=A0A8E6B746_9BACT|nr:hypothetical protein KIH39_05370 [Telmatocola sphagniphila]